MFAQHYCVLSNFRLQSVRVDRNDSKERATIFGQTQPDSWFEMLTITKVKPDLVISARLINDFTVQIVFNDQDNFLIVPELRLLA